MAITLNGTTGIDAGASLEADAITLAGANVATQAYADAVTPTSFTGNGFSAYRNTTQSISSATFTKVQHNTEVFDTGGEFDNATNYRFTPTKAGKYLVVAYGKCLVGSIHIVINSIYVNGTRTYDSIVQGSNPSSTIGTPAVAVVDMNGSTDYVEHYFYQNSGTSSNLQTGPVGCNFSAMYLGD